jgi:catechol 2,3-dioxygenase-like lactoylglutathione lyase family enzyme
VTPAAVGGRMRIDNFDVYCSDASAMVPFYSEVLGLPFFLPYEDGSGWAALQAGDVTIYIFETDGEHAAPRTPVTEENPPGIDSFAFEVADLDEAIAELDGKVKWAGDAERWDHRSGTWYRYRSFHDPEGNLLHVTEPHKA